MRALSASSSFRNPIRPCSLKINSQGVVSLLPVFIYHSSTNSSSSLILNIITNSPIVTTMNRANENHPSTMAVVPTPLWTLPFPRSWAIVLAATDAVCCHSTLTRTNTEAIKMRASADWDTGREGKGLTSRSEPRSSISSCQPGKVARRMKQTNARMMATILSRERS